MFKLVVSLYKASEHFIILMHQCVVQCNDVIVSAYVYA